MPWIPAAFSCHVGAVAFATSCQAANPMIRTATRPAAPNIAIGPQFVPWLTLTGATGLRPLAPPDRPAGAFFATGRAFDEVAFAGRALSVGALSVEAVSGLSPSAATALVNLFAVGRRTSPVLMLMGPRHDRLFGVARGAGGHRPPPSARVYPDNIGQ
jgi:hypothetical protein